MSDKALEIAQKFYDQHPEILVCDENSEMILGWLENNSLRFSLNNLNEAALALEGQLAQKYTDAEIHKMTGDQYKRLVLPYCSDLPENLRKKLKPRDRGPETPAEAMRLEARKDWREAQDKFLKQYADGRQ
jgi:hypothetical protein